MFWLEEDVDPFADPGLAVSDVFVTRLHLRYDEEHFPDDLVFTETDDRENFQGRYILEHPWTGPMDCDAGPAYTAHLSERFEREAQALATLTDWPIQDIRNRMDASGQRITMPEDPDGPSPGLLPAPD